MHIAPYSSHSFFLLWYTRLTNKLNYVPLSIDPIVAESLVISIQLFHGSKVLISHTHNDDRHGQV